MSHQVNYSSAIALLCVMPLVKQIIYDIQFSSIYLFRLKLSHMMYILNSSNVLRNLSNKIVGIILLYFLQLRFFRVKTVLFLLNESVKRNILYLKWEEKKILLVRMAIVFICKSFLLMIQMNIFCWVICIIRICLVFCWEQIYYSLGKNRG